MDSLQALVSKLPISSFPCFNIPAWSIVAYVLALLAWLICLSSLHLLDPTKAAQIFSKTSAAGCEFSSDSLEACLTPIRALQHVHETAEKLNTLIEKGGAGSWPPRASHGDAWPAALQTYHDIYLTLAPLLPTTEVLCDDKANAGRINAFRMRMKTLLREGINLVAVENILGSGKDQISADAWNGLFGCIAISRHAYRWATIPVVRAAQVDKLISFPAELDIPWKHLQKRYGVTSAGGNVTSNYFCNFTSDGTLSLPIYKHIVAATIAFTSTNISTTLNHLRAINAHLLFPLKFYYDTLTDAKISRSVWMTYVQGFQGWGAGHLTANGEYIEYDGLSGNQLLLPMIIDAFTGMPLYLTEESMKRYIPVQQREFVDSMFRATHRQISAGEQYHPESEGSFSVPRYIYDEEVETDRLMCIVRAAAVVLQRRKWEGLPDGDVNITAEDFDALLGHADAVVETPAWFFASEMIQAYPDAKVVLNLRQDLDAWHRSAMESLMEEVEDRWSIQILKRLTAPFF
ncbi:indoleamine 23-dioxygenase protein [Aspergillus terreus]|uniref:Indoleamine 23-dioxygenase protein n=1 Tax=Aspergillus terreus TaxID=33178 RepID=A0A5M3Z269_ASPTE|nr:hypothetical protein ATETN484_0005068000 [Aspergillus terreus]GFF17332.1 indoleamine 23-dioxygenase protein [Aspergillus terreus]